MNTNAEKQINPRKEELIKLSIKAREIRQAGRDNAQTAAELDYWENIRINDIIAGWYKDETGAKEFRTLKQWNEEGYRVKKGSKSFVLWARKKETTVQRENPESGEVSEDSYKFFPMAYLFSDQQVEKGGSNAN